MSIPRHGAPPRALQDLGPAALPTGSVRTGRVPSAPRRTRDNNSKVRAVLGKLVGVFQVLAELPSAGVGLSHL